MTGFTQTPNEYFDNLLPEITSISELKVLMIAIRQTVGWQKEVDTISLTQFQQRTGLTRQGVINGIELCLKRGTLIREPTKRNGFVYRLSLEAATSQQNRLVNNVDQSIPLTTTSQQNRPVEAPTSQRNRHTKETSIKQTTTKEIYVDDSPQFKLAKLLREKILANDDRANVPKLDSDRFQTWCHEIDLLIKKDGRAPPDIARIIVWCQEDDFWRSNILSAKKLREKFGQLYLRAQQNGRTRKEPVNASDKPAPTNSQGVPLRDVYRDAGRKVTVPEVRET